MSLAFFFISLFPAQRVSDVNTSILRSLRIICGVISWDVLLWYDACWCYVVVWLWWCGIRMQWYSCTSLPPVCTCFSTHISRFPDYFKITHPVVLSYKIRNKQITTERNFIKNSYSCTFRPNWSTLGWLLEHIKRSIHIVLWK